MALKLNPDDLQVTSFQATAIASGGGFCCTGCDSGCGINPTASGCDSGSDDIFCKGAVVEVQALAAPAVGRECTGCVSGCGIF